MREYFADITAEINATKPNDRLLLGTMVLDPRVTEIQALINAAIAAAKRGVIVDIAFDTQSYMLDPQSRVLRKCFLANTPERYTHGMYRDLLNLRVRMDLNGVRTHLTNTPRFPVASPFHGRSHIKVCIINDVLYIGGCNLSLPGDIDMMVRFRDIRAADWLYETLLPAYQSQQIREYLHSTDTSFAVNDTTALLIDTGKKNQSIIYKAALRLIDEAQESLVMTCQFFPGGTTAKHLAAAHNRGVKVNLIYNSPHEHASKLFEFAHTAVTSYARKTLPRALFRHELPAGYPYMHAKILVSEKSGMIGSHNYVSQGVHYGTAELALLCSSPEFLQQLRAQTKSLITLLP